MGLLQWFTKGRVAKVVRLREALVADCRRAGEDIIVQTIAEALTGPAPVASGYHSQGQAVVLYATTERLIWAGYRGGRYVPHPFPDGDYVRSVEYGSFKDFGAIGVEAGMGFGAIVFDPDQTASLADAVRRGLIPPSDLELWSVRVGMVRGVVNEFVAMAVDIASDDLLQLFRFPVWGPAGERLVEGVASHQPWDDPFDGPKTGSFAPWHRTLRLEDIPSDDASWEAPLGWAGGTYFPSLSRFALTFDGYAAVADRSSVGETYTQVLEEWKKTGDLASIGLTELRIALFHVQMRNIHVGDLPTGEWDVLARAVVSEIRLRVAEHESGPKRDKPILPPGSSD